MTNRERLKEQYEDALFALLMELVAEEEGKQVLELNECLKTDPAAEVPESIRRRCEMTIRREFYRKKAKKFGRETWKVVQRLSIAVMLMVVLLTTAMAVSEPFRLGVLNAVINTYEQYTELIFEEKSDDAPQSIPTEEAEPSDDWTYYYGLGFEWIPEGYTAGANGWVDETGERSVSLYDTAHHCINVSVTPYLDSSSYKFDSEDSEKIDVDVQGYSASLYVKDPAIRYKRLLIWLDEKNNYIIQITSSGEAEGAPSSEDILALAKGLHW